MASQPPMALAEPPMASGELPNGPEKRLMFMAPAEPPVEPAEPPMGSVGPPMGRRGPPWRRRNHQRSRPWSRRNRPRGRRSRPRQPCLRPSIGGQGWDVNGKLSPARLRAGSMMIELRRVSRLEAGSSAPFSHSGTDRIRALSARVRTTRADQRRHRASTPGGSARGVALCRSDVQIF